MHEDRPCFPQAPPAIRLGGRSQEPWADEALQGLGASGSDEVLEHVRGVAPDDGCYHGDDGTDAIDKATGDDDTKLTGNDCNRSWPRAEGVALVGAVCTMAPSAPGPSVAISSRSRGGDAPPEGRPEDHHEAEDGSDEARDGDFGYPHAKVKCKGKKYRILVKGPASCGASCCRGT